MIKFFNIICLVDSGLSGGQEGMFSGDISRKQKEIFRVRVQNWEVYDSIVELDL